jgi:ABC-type glycerol-3-phosphate transport system permease component
MHTVDVARYWPSPFPASPVSGWTAWPLRIGARFKVVVRVISAALVVGIVPIAILIVIFQERVVSGLTSGGIKG